jgi:hypothetical protein
MEERRGEDGQNIFLSSIFLYVKHTLKRLRSKK